MKKIIALQTNEMGRNCLKGLLLDIGLIEGGDFEIFSNPQDVSQHILPDESQLFITGTFGGLTKGVKEFIQELKNKNQKLICISYSDREFEGPFEVHVNKMFKGGVAIKGVVKDFLEEKITRT